MMGRLMVRQMDSLKEIQMHLEIVKDSPTVKLTDSLMVKLKHSVIDSVRLTVIPMD